MGWFERFKDWLLGRRIPDETRAALEGFDDARLALKELDRLATQNEMEIERLNREIERLEKMETEQVEKLKEGGVGERSKRVILRTIQRLRMQMDNLENRITIYENNVRLHLALIGRLQQMEAMELSGVGEEEIDEVLFDFEAALEEYEEKLQAARLIETAKAPKETVSDEEALKSLEVEIMSETKEQDVERKVKEAEPSGRRKEEEPEGESEAE